MSERKRATGKPGETKDGAELGFEEALARLEVIVAGLEDGRTSLEDSVRAYAEGMKLVTRCLERLSEAEATVKELTEAAGEFRLRTPAGDDRDEGGDEGDEEA